MSNAEWLRAWREVHVERQTKTSCKGSWSLSNPKRLRWGNFLLSCGGWASLESGSKINQKKEVIRASTKKRLFQRCRSILFQVFLEVATVNFRPDRHLDVAVLAALERGLYKLYNWRHFSQGSTEEERMPVIVRGASPSRAKGDQISPSHLRAGPRRTRCWGLRLAFIDWAGHRPPDGHLGTSEAEREDGSSHFSTPFFDILCFIVWRERQWFLPIYCPASMPRYAFWWERFGAVRASLSVHKQEPGEVYLKFATATHNTRHSM